MNAPLLGEFLMDTGEPIGSVPAIISIASRSSSKLRTPDGTKINKNVLKRRNYLSVTNYNKMNISLFHLMNLCETTNQLSRRTGLSSSAKTGCD